MFNETIWKYSVKATNSKVSLTQRNYFLIQGEWRRLHPKKCMPVCLEVRQKLGTLWSTSPGHRREARQSKRCWFLSIHIHTVRTPDLTFVADYAHCRAAKRSSNQNPDVLGRLEKPDAATERQTSCFTSEMLSDKQEDRTAYCSMLVQSDKQ